MRATLLLAALSLLATTTLAAPPRVVDASPDHGDADVDPATTEIRVTFDQPMDTRGRSIVGGGDSFPHINGDIRWIGRTTIVIPVRLRPDHDYWLSINNARFTNFRNTKGEPAIPYPIQFRTAPADGADADAPDAATTESNAAAADALANLLETRYAYRDRLGLDWRALVADNRDALVRAASPADFARTAATLLARAQGKHLFLEAGGQRVATFISPRVPNANPGLLPTLVPEYERLSPVVATGRWPDAVAYLRIDTWDASRAGDVEAMYEALWRAHDARALIIDARLNAGGDETLARGLAGCFIDERVLYAKHRYVGPDAEGGFGIVHQRWLEPSRRRPRLRVPVVVLSGPVVMSSNEAFILMMKAIPGATVVGARTQGSSGNPQPHDLPNDVTLYLPSWQALTADGEPFEGVGIEPDVDVDAAPTDFARRDPVLERALEIARGGCP